jgi:hypothetical protein
MTLPKFVSIALVSGSLLSQVSPTSAIQVKYNINFFSVPTNLLFSDQIQVVGGNQFRYVSNGTLIENPVGSGFLSYDTDNLLPPYTPKGTSFEVDELSLNLRGKSLTLDDFGVKVLGNDYGPLETGSTIFFQLNAKRVLDESTGIYRPATDPQTGLPATPNLLLIQSYPAYGTGCLFPATQCIEERPNYGGLLEPSSALYPPSQFTGVYSPYGVWRWFDEGDPGSSRSTDQGIFFTSLEEPKQVPEPSTQIFEILSSLLLFFGLLRLRFLRIVRTQQLNL